MNNNAKYIKNDFIKTNNMYKIYKKTSMHGEYSVLVLVV